MNKRNGQMKLGVNLVSCGHHVAAWRHPAVRSGRTLKDYVALVSIAEAAKLDLVFIADNVAANTANLEISSRMGEQLVLEPLTLMSALASVTSSIGLVGTASTTFTEPYNLARQFCSFDHVSAGRAGWNVVTTQSADAAKNFSNVAMLGHDERYLRAEEFVDVVRGLWDSWEDDAFPQDQESGRFFDPAKVHYLNHVGKYFSVRGPLNIPRSPQGWPIIVQAGASGPGRELAARVADVIFAAHQTVEEATSFYSDVKARASKFGRAASDVVILPGVTPIVGRTEAEAYEKQQQLHNLIDPAVALYLLSGFLSSEIDLTKFSADGPVPPIPKSEGNQSRQALVVDMARRENLTLGETALRFADARGHWHVVGTAEQVADQLEDCFLRYGSDGFNILPSLLPSGLQDFVEMVIPELRRRGLFRSEYEGATLRENLGLRRPNFRSDILTQS